MRRAFPRLGGGAIFALALIAGAGEARADNGVTPVTVQNPGDIAKAIVAPHPIVLSFSFETDQGAQPFTVPAKQRLLIEFIAGHCSVAGQTTLDEIAIESENGVFPIQMPVLAGGSALTQASFAYVTKVFIEAGQSVNVAPVQFGTTGNGPAIFTCGSTFSGELLEAP